MKTTTTNQEIINKIREGEELNQAEKIQFMNALQNAITKNHSGKMEGLQSLSTSVLLNENCKKNASISGSICSHCYASKLLKMRHALDGKMEENTNLLTSVIIPMEYLPTTYTLYFRFEAFGDLNNATQVVNYFNIARKNPQTRFALFTKNPHFIKEAIEEKRTTKPENINIIFSSLFINTKNESTMKKYNFIDKVFTVYDPKYIKDQNVDINCGGRHCASCLRCYTKNDIKHISEKLK